MRVRASREDLPWLLLLGVAIPESVRLRVRFYARTVFSGVSYVGTCATRILRKFPGTYPPHTGVFDVF